MALEQITFSVRKTIAVPSGEGEDDWKTGFARRLCAFVVVKMVSFGAPSSRCGSPLISEERACCVREVRQKVLTAPGPIGASRGAWWPLPCPLLPLARPAVGPARTNPLWSAPAPRRWPRRNPERWR